MGKKLLTSLKTMFDAFDSELPSLTITNKNRLANTYKKIKTEVFYKLYEGIKDMRTNLGDASILQYVLCSNYL
ncbi:hypothetical protein M1146_06950, partial [Patescibacteria group bacterium]|nr:hypothetical protein [Patescibacteria group bacterium]